MAPRLIATDLDGTLLNAASQISARTVTAIATAVEAGIDVVVATGRSHWSALPIIAPLRHVRWLICSNGAVVIDRHQDSVVVERPLGDLVAKQTMLDVQAAFPEVGFAWETAAGLFYSEQFRANRESARPGSVFGTTSPSVAETDQTGLLRLMVSHPSLTQHEWLDAVRPHIPDHLEVSTSSADMVEVCGPGADKGLALAALCDQLGVPADAVVAFGDHANDLGMLRWAGTSYVMDNAEGRMKETHTLIAPHHDEDGVAQILDMLAG